MPWSPWSFIGLPVFALDHAVENGKLAAAVKAEHLRGKAGGRIEHVGSSKFARMSDADLHEFIRSEAQALGIEVPAPKIKDGTKH